MLMTRNKAQNIAMIIIYQCLCYDEMNLKYDIKELISDNLEEPFDEVDLYIKRVVVSAIAHKKEIKENITKYLRDWSFNRLSKIMQAILFLAYAHYHYIEKTDRKIIINVAIKQAKTFLDKNNYRFVNGILENLL